MRVKNERENKAIKSLYLKTQRDQNGLRGINMSSKQTFFIIEVLSFLKNNK